MSEVVKTEAEPVTQKCDLCPGVAVIEFKVVDGHHFFRCEGHSHLGFNAAQQAEARKLDVFGDEFKPWG